MRCRTFGQASLATLGALSACALLAPAGTSYAFLGGTLDLSQRDVRVCNNFSDPEANDNLATDPNFPGAVGAPLAIWKAIVEWGSEPRAGNGLGDPTQPGNAITPGGLGSGGANFDSSWQGLSPWVGRVDANIISEISGSLGGIFAFTDLPIQDGWRIRFYRDAAVWHDGPGAPPAGGGNADIQGVATHEYGHALGLAHSSFSGATMGTVLTGSMWNFRSIEPDDVAGVQALYGVRDPAKPRVASYHFDGASVRILGSGFAPTGNDVWFTDSGPAPDGTPFQVTNLASANGGTLIVAPRPPEAGPGEILVKIPGTSGAALSNAFPYDPAENPCAPPAAYGTAKTTSLGATPSLYALGRPHLQTNDLLIGTAFGIPNTFGVLLTGSAPASIPFQGGTLLVGGVIERSALLPFDFLGFLEVPIPIDASIVGTRRYYQIWFLDPGDPFGVGLSDAIGVTFCP